MQKKHASELERVLPLVLTLRQASEQLGIGVRTLARLRASQKLPTVRLGPRRIGIARKALCDLIEKGGVS